MLAVTRKGDAPDNARLLLVWLVSDEGQGLVDAVRVWFNPVVHAGVPLRHLASAAKHLRSSRVVQVRRHDTRAHPGANAAQWWRNAVVYQVYVRSFADANGDGVGDLAGVRSRLSYLRELGVDALWFNPWYASPMADAGYDVADYRSIHPSLGTLTEAEALIAEARASGIRTIIDIVPNHVSREHRWFRQALTALPGAPERARFWFRPGAGPDGGQPPNRWPSFFGGRAWSRSSPNDEWYLHLFAPDPPTWCRSCFPTPPRIPRPSCVR